MIFTIPLIEHNSGIGNGIFSRSGKSNTNQCFKTRIEKDEDDKEFIEEQKKMIKNDENTGMPKLQRSYFHSKNHVLQLRKTMGVLDESEIGLRLDKKNKFMNQSNTGNIKEEPKIELSEIYEPPPRFIINPSLNTTTNKVEKLSSSFNTVSREYELKKAQK